MTMAWWRRDAVRGIKWVLIGTFLSSLVWASGKLAGGDIPALQIVFLRYVGGFGVLLMAVWARGVRLRPLLSARPHLHILRALCGAGGGVCAIYAPMHMPIADATAIGLIQGMFTVALAVVFLRERVSGAHWLAALTCAAGALIVISGQGTGAVGLAKGQALPAAAAFLGALLIAGEMILIKVLSVHERALVVLLYVNGLAALLLTAPALTLWRSPSTGELLGLALLGPLAITAQYCNIRGFRLADAALLAPVGYSWILFAGLIGFLAFGERPSLATLLGGVLIAAGGVTLTRLHTRTRRPLAKTLESG